MKKNKLILLTLVLVLVVSMFAGCSSKPADAPDTGNETTETPGETVAKEEIVIAQPTDIKSLDPHATNDSGSSTVNRQIFGSLVRHNEQMEIVGDLAESWEPIDELTWEFKLKQGVKWHDGTDFTSEDVKFSLERQKASASVGHLVNVIEEIEIIDENTVRFHTSVPFGPMLPNLAHSGSRIVSKKAVEEFGDEIAEHPVGTGAYKFVEWIPGDRVVLERFDDYFEEIEGAKTLVVRAIPEGTSRTIALETGEVDLVVTVEPNDKKVVEGNSDLKLYELMSNRVEYLAFNFNKAPYDNKLVRQAINHVINKDAINIVAADGRGEPSKTVIGKKVLGYNPDVPAYEHNVDKAKELLAEAGYPDGFDTTLWASGDVRNRIAQVIQANLAEIGINASIELLEWGAYIDRTSAGEHDMFLLGWTNLTADGDGGMFPLFHSSRMGAGGNRSFYSNPEVDALLDGGRQEVITEKRAPYYQEAQLLIMEDAPWVPLYYTTVDLGARADLKGVELHPGSMHRFYNLHY